MKKSIGIGAIAGLVFAAVTTGAPQANAQSATWGGDSHVQWTAESRPSGSVHLTKIAVCESWVPIFPSHWNETIYAVDTNATTPSLWTNTTQGGGTWTQLSVTNSGATQYVSDLECSAGKIWGLNSDSGPNRFRTYLQNNGDGTYTWVNFENMAGASALGGYDTVNFVTGATTPTLYAYNNINGEHGLWINTQPNDTGLHWTFVNTAGVNVGTISGINSSQVLGLSTSGALYILGMDGTYGLLLNGASGVSHGFLVDIAGNGNSGVVYSLDSSGNVYRGTPSAS